MTWQTPKTGWDAKDAIRDVDLNRIEENVLFVREEDSLLFFFEIRSDYPSHSPGRAFYHSVDKKVYTSTGTAWV